MRDFQSIQATAYDLIVIGGGINGAGIARDAALRGLKTLLLEKGDFGSGTTSWSSRLIHGGLRYLEYLELNLVRESLREREVLLRTAPHLVKPLQMTIPIYRDGTRNYWQIQAGMLLYDLLSLDKTVPSHQMLPAQKFRQVFRGVRSEALVGAAQYYDGQVEYAERLCLELVLSAQAAGATVLNYVAVTQLHLGDQGTEIRALTCTDRLTGAGVTVNSQGAIVVNTSGPWVDQVCGLARQNAHPTALGSRKIGGTKGSHIVVDSFPEAPKTALYVEAHADGRPFFILPWLGKYLIGTTDLYFKGDLDCFKADNAEIDYLLAEANRVLPSALLTRADVRFTYSGVRPLPYAEGKKPGSITRSHILYDHTSDGVTNLISLIGGKLTTFRQVAVEMVTQAYRKLKRPVPPCLTASQPLLGEDWNNSLSIKDAVARYRQHVARISIQHVYALYGAKAPEVLALVDDAPDLGERIVAYLPDIKAQAVYAVKSEMAHTLVDICRRRTVLSMLANYGFDALPALTETLAQHCGWSREECDRQVTDYRTYIETNCLPDYCLTGDQTPQTSLETPVSVGS
jgi:glycerol-3-phosphate dehydrogenase